MEKGEKVKREERKENGKERDRFFGYWHTTEEQPNLYAHTRL